MFAVISPALSVYLDGFAELKPLSRRQQKVDLLFEGSREDWVIRARHCSN